MSGPSIDLEERNPLGGLDLLATGIGLAVIAVFPTLLATLVAPWKLGPVLVADEPDGRRGMILSPGAYLVLSLAVVLVMVGSLVSPDVARNDGGLIGPRLAADVSSAARAGDVWLTLSRIAPVFIITLLFGVVGRGLTRWAGEWWDLRTSLRASFYAISTAICWIVLLSLGMDIAARLQSVPPASQRPPGLSPVLVIGSIYWIYFWCFRSGGGLTVRRALLLTLAMLGLSAAVMTAMGLLLFSDGLFGGGA
ncbi:MAG: hypothetical protein WBF53_11150 [Litorimonas sp.]